MQSEVEKALKPEFASALSRFGTMDLAHSGRTLHEHLLGTFRLLGEWGCEAHVCSAGLFHSIYGTNAFAPACLTLEKRRELQSLIGTRAEQLVFWFASSERPAGFLLAAAGHPLRMRNGTSEHVPAEQIRELLTIECANLFEQDASSSLLSALRRLDIDECEALIGARATVGIRTSR